MIYPRWMNLASWGVIGSFFVSIVCGLLSPGPLTGFFVALSVSCVWILYRIIVRYEVRTELEGKKP